MWRYSDIYIKTVVFWSSDAFDVWNPRTIQTTQSLWWKRETWWEVYCAPSATWGADEGSSSLSAWAIKTRKGCLSHILQSTANVSWSRAEPHGRSGPRTSYPVEFCWASSKTVETKPEQLMKSGHSWLWKRQVYACGMSAGQRWQLYKTI